MTLNQYQQAFCALVAHFIIELNRRGYGVTFGEAWRSPTEAAINAKEKTGIRDSLHCERLAVDLNLFKEGHWLTTKEEYREAGELWEAQSQTDLYKLVWGGNFKEPDSDHFSMSYEGRA